MKQVIIFILFLSFIILINSCSKENEAAVYQSNAVSVKTTTVNPERFNEYLNVTGTVKALSDVQVIAEEGGILLRLKADKGNWVQKGDTIAFLENKIVENTWRQTNALLKQAELDFKSKKTLYAQKAISELEYLNSKYGLEQAKAAYDLAESRYYKLFLTATVSGRINDRYFDKGAYVAPMSPVFELINNTRVKIIAGIAERFYNTIEVGSPIIITLDAFPGLKISTGINYKSNKVDPQSRTFRVEAEFDNPDRKIGAEQLANLRILKKIYEDKIVVPQDIVIESEDGSYVFINQDNQAVQIPINIIAIYKDSLVVEGLNAGDELIVVGQRNVADKDEIIISKESN